MMQGTQSQGFVTPTEVGWGGSFQKEGTYVADSCWCMAETITIL